MWSIQFKVLLTLLTLFWDVSPLYPITLSMGAAVQVLFSWTTISPVRHETDKAWHVGCHFLSGRKCARHVSIVIPSVLSVIRYLPTICSNNNPSIHPSHIPLTLSSPHGFLLSLTRFWLLVIST